MEAIRSLLQADVPLWLDAQPATEIVDIELIAHFHALGAEKIAAMQSKQINRLLAHARLASPIWKDRLEVRASVLRQLPILRREDYRRIADAGALPLPPGRGEAREGSTSGSSGVPVRFYQDALSTRLMTSHALYRRRQHGVLDGRPAAAIVPGIPHHAGEHLTGTSRPYIGEGPMIVRNARQFTIGQHARWIADQARPYLVTVPTILRGVADIYEGETTKPPRIESILTFAETVEDALRDRVRDLFGATIRDVYSCEEIGAVAIQCPRYETAYHTVVTNAVVEVVDEAGGAVPEGAPGRVVVTGLNNYASPAIRYELGDLASWRRSCRCGFAAPVLENVLGRERFLIKLPSGERKYVGTPSRPWIDIAPFRERRLIQREEGRLCAELVLDRPISREECEQVRDLLRHEISPSLSYDVIQVDAIDWASTYKRQDVVSLI